ncbi:unnamed protein product [Polarella glacialis]|uniref:Uncharacterized protein n=1 Tax=Polarella glacialis TaxID=89957 RepID=A0A813GTP5_POLGL|nr:unnamed protein product [Polarella glacialis]
MAVANPTSWTPFALFSASPISLRFALATCRNSCTSRARLGINSHFATKAATLFIDNNKRETTISLVSIWLQSVQL